LLASKGPGLDCWITSDGHAYVAQLHERAVRAGEQADPAHDGDDTQVGTGVYASTMISYDSQEMNDIRLAPENAQNGGTPRGSQWQGVCIYAFELPRWVQKRRKPDSAENEPGYDEPRRATSAAINARFSLVAVGTHGGFVHLIGLPSQEGAPPVSQPLAPPVNAFGSRTTGAVIAMEWSSDGYVLAVGWEHGWAVWSVGGRCLASAFDLEEQSLDKTKFQDAFMYGVKQLVSLMSLLYSIAQITFIVLGSRELRTCSARC
jgi:hypothetical protein